MIPKYDPLAEHIGKTHLELERIFGPMNWDKEILNFMLTRPQPFWMRHEYKGKVYIMTFQYVVFEVLPRTNSEMK